jgi:dimethylhistidine N-methyltransferase
MITDDIEGIDYFVDLQPETEDFLATVLSGLSQTQKAIPPKFFYDAKGSHIFDQICETPEYYVTRTEIALLVNIQAEIDALVKPDSVIVEYGCGSSLKIRALLSALSSAAGYVAIDISKSHLIATAIEIATEYPDIRVGAICADFAAELEWPEQAGLAQKGRLAFFPGSTIGNQTPQEAVQLLERVRHMVGDEGNLLIGVDLKKDFDLLNSAYNDAAGHTADFNLNLLHRMKNELNADLDISAFAHNAFYNEELSRMEMHLVSKVPHSIKIDGQTFNFKKGESIHTENSYKYSKVEFGNLARKAGFDIVESWCDENDLFSIHYMKSI